MDDDTRKNEVYAMLGRYLCGELIEHTGKLEGSYYYCSWEDDQELWLAYPREDGFRLGASRMIVISRKTGKIIGDQMVGE